MAENISDEFRDKIGVEWELGVYDIEKGMIQKFARAIGDPNPLWQDEEYSKQGQYGGIIAPPTFMMTIGNEQFGQVLAPMFGDVLLLGSSELECHQLVRPGDRMAATAKLVNVRERQSSKMVFVTFDITYTNQRQELVAKCRQVLIGYET